MEDPLLSLDSDMSVVEAVPLEFFLDITAFFDLVSAITASCL